MIKYTNIKNYFKDEKVKNTVIKMFLRYTKLLNKNNIFDYNEDIIYKRILNRLLKEFWQRKFNFVIFDSNNFKFN